MLAVEKQYLKVPSKDGIHKLNVVVWKPQAGSEIKAVLQISHGMIEFIERYDDFARYLVENGYAVVGHDHLGHGSTARNEDEWGYFARKNASQTVVDDVYQVTRKIRKMYPNTKLVLLGHSMGSFIARRYLMTYGKKIDAAIIMGTASQPKIAIVGGKAIIKVLKCIYGDKHRSKFIENIMFGLYNSHFSKDRNGKEWLTKDDKIREWYCNEPGCTFKFTLNGYELILETIGYIQKQSNINKIPKDLPIHIVAGKEDPVGNYGKGVEHVYNVYRKAGVKDISVHLYDNDRHEILNETDRQLVYKDILNWLDKHC
ncbi:alpha/beta hydrolase [Anaerosporobacter sp.]|uniref:alpha/beta hydrolase n=1 Tax=Anaerosporobacter sp. TaxID=1872529 RepID=UPI00286F2225|nr:alpha/beta hydrolase [Anaerosporobacter sp.]